MTLKESPNLGEGTGWGRAWKGSHPFVIPEKTSPVNYWITHSSADVGEIPTLKYIHGHYSKCLLRLLAKLYT